MRDDDVLSAFLIAGDLVHEMPEVIDAVTRQCREVARKKAEREAWRKYRDGGLAEQLGGYVPNGIDMVTGRPTDPQKSKG